MNYISWSETVALNYVFLTDLYHLLIRYLIWYFKLWLYYLGNGTCNGDWKAKGEICVCPQGRIGPFCENTTTGPALTSCQKKALAYTVLRGGRLVSMSNMSNVIVLQQVLPSYNNSVGPNIDKLHVSTCLFILEFYCSLSYIHQFTIFLLSALPGNIFVKFYWNNAEKH